MQVPPKWCIDKMDCWEVIVDKWCTEAWMTTHNMAKDRRAHLVGVPYHQGNANIKQYVKKWAKFHNKHEPEGFSSFAMAHKGPYRMVKAYSEGDGPSAYTSRAAYKKMMAYSEVDKQLRGPEFDPSQRPMYPEALMISGGSKSHGSEAMLDGFVPCPETLSQIKARQPSFAPAIWQCARLVDLAIQISIYAWMDARVVSLYIFCVVELVIYGLCSVGLVMHYLL